MPSYTHTQDSNILSTIKKHQKYHGKGIFGMKEKTKKNLKAYLS